jgi:hypothetical protein
MAYRIDLAVPILDGLGGGFPRPHAPLRRPIFGHNDA